jgi:hypothetical protein
MHKKRSDNSITALKKKNFFFFFFRISEEEKKLKHYMAHALLTRPGAYSKKYNRIE